MDTSSYDFCSGGGRAVSRRYVSNKSHKAANRQGHRNTEVKRDLRWHATALMAATALVICSGSYREASLPPTPLIPPHVVAHVVTVENAIFKEIGRVSWYGHWHQGKQTASGERYNMYQMTAAHRTLPLGTIVRVTNPANGKSVKVRINDRGPYVKGRVLDLSAAAAKALGISHQGTAKLQIEAFASDQPAG
jgi:rare lipoprotein A (peptidoglycan hydrolase)